MRAELDATIEAVLTAAARAEQLRRAAADEREHHARAAAALRESAATAFAAVSGESL